MRSLKLHSTTKTTFGKSALFSLFQAFFPALIVWIVFGKDIVTISLTINLEWQIAISVILLTWCLFSTFICYLLGWTNYDQFGFSIPISLVMIIIFFTSFYPDLNIWIRIIICLFSVLIISVLVNLLIYFPKFKQQKK